MESVESRLKIQSAGYSIPRLEPLTWPWTNTIDTNAFLDLLIRQSSRECYNCPLRRGVVKQISPADIWIDRGTIDDRGSGLHMREGVFRKIEERVDVGVEALLPLLPIEVVSKKSQLLHGLPRNSSLIEFADIAQHVLKGGIVDQNIDATHSL